MPDAKFLLACQWSGAAETASLTPAAGQDVKLQPAADAHSREPTMELIAHSCLEGAASSLSL